VIAGAHVLLYASDAPAARAFIRDMLGFDNVEAHEGWLIFALPPAELGVHPAGGETERRSGDHELFLMCHDIQKTVEELSARGVETAPIEDQGFGLITSLKIPGAGAIGIYQPKHKSPLAEFSGD
jgi:catechol 2,3-dioxygenase-like lactoylglutathione lyase family enzyme